MIPRSATVQDATRLADLHATAFLDAWSADALAAFIGSPAVIALEVSGLGFILLGVAADEAEILTLAVAPSARRRGIAQALVGAALGMARDRGVRSCFLEVAVENDAARALYARFGFVEAGRRKGYYDHVGSASTDALVLRCSLDRQGPGTHTFKANEEA
jgi:ribosomal-protein-alanine N-acetyltransferase